MPNDPQIALDSLLLHLRSAGMHVDATPETCRRITRLLNVTSGDRMAMDAARAAGARAEARRGSIELSRLLRAAPRPLLL